MKKILLFLAFAGCSNPAPQCAPRGEAYEVCSDDGVWECPAGPADVVAFNVAVDDACNLEDDPVQCILDAEYEYVDMTLTADCGAGAQVCVEDPLADPKVATCQDP